MLAPVFPAPPSPALHTLPNGLRIAVVPMPWRQTVSLSVFIRTGSLHESRGLSGISHVVEHMAFKGTPTRDCQRINLDAERLGAEVNAHTDKDHTAYHLEGLPRDLPAFVELLGDIVRHPTFPEDELERERQVILHEFTEYEEDPVSLAFECFDRACYGDHPAGRPVIGRRANVMHLTRQDLLDYVARQYTACNVIVAAAGPVDEAALLRATEAAFGDMPRGTPHAVPMPQWQGGVKVRRVAGSGQCQVVLGYESPSLADPRHVQDQLAAAVLGEGMSSPLLDELRERRGLAYHVAGSVDVLSYGGQMVIEAATGPEQAADVLQEAERLMRQHADRCDATALERARNQLTVRALRALEQPARRLETVAQEIYIDGRPRDPRDWLDRLAALEPGDVCAVFGRWLAGRPAVGLAGKVPARARERAEALLRQAADTLAGQHPQGAVARG